MQDRESCLIDIGEDIEEDQRLSVVGVARESHDGLRLNTSALIAPLGDKEVLRHNFLAQVKFVHVYGCRIEGENVTITMAFLV